MTKEVPGMKGLKEFVRFNAKDFDPRDVGRCLAGGGAKNNIDGVSEKVLKAFWSGVLAGLLLAVGALLAGWFLQSLFG